MTTGNCHVPSKYVTRVALSVNDKNILMRLKNVSKYSLMLGVDIKFYVNPMNDAKRVQIPATDNVKDIKEIFFKEITELRTQRTLKATIKQAVDNLQ